MKRIGVTRPEGAGRTSASPINARGLRNRLDVMLWLSSRLSLLLLVVLCGCLDSKSETYSGPIYGTVAWTEGANDRSKIEHRVGETCARYGRKPIFENDTHRDTVTLTHCSI
jgi:hypothetical protein